MTIFCSSTSGEIKMECVYHNITPMNNVKCGTMTCKLHFSNTLINSSDKKDKFFHETPKHLVFHELSLVFIRNKLSSPNLRLHLFFDTLS